MTISTKTVPEMMKKKDDNSTTNCVHDDNNNINDNANVITSSSSEIIVTSNDKNEKKKLLCSKGENMNDKSSIEVSSDNKEGAGVVSQACASPKPCSPISTVSSSVMQEMNESNIEYQSTVMTPVLVMSSDEKTDPNVVVEEQAGNNIDNEIESKKLKGSSDNATSMQEEKRRRETAESHGESSICADDTKRRKIESCSLDEHLKIEPNLNITDDKTNGTTRSQKLEDKVMSLVSRSSSDALIENSDPRSSQISSLINHRKDLLDRIRFCQSVCYMRLQQPQQQGVEKDDEICAFKQLSQKVLQSIKKGSSKNNHNLDDAHGGNSSISSGGGDTRITPARSSRVSNKKKSQLASVAGTTLHANTAYLPPTPVRENLSGKKNIPAQPLNLNHRINADIHGAIDLCNKKEAKQIPSYQQPQHMLPRVSSMTKSGISSNLPSTYPPSSNKQDGNKTQNFIPMSTVIAGSSIQNVRKNSSIKGTLPLNVTSKSAAVASDINAQKSTKSTGRISNNNSNTNLTKNINKRNVNAAGHMKNKADMYSSLASSSSNLETKKSSSPNLELQNLRDVRNSLRRKLSSTHNQRNSKLHHSSTSTTQKASHHRGTTSITSSPTKPKNNSKFDSASSLISASRLPLRRKTHWDYLLEEMRWSATDFIEERKWKIASSRTLSYSLKESNSKSQAALSVAITTSNTSTDIKSCKRVASLLSNIMLVHWDKMVRERALSAQDGEVIYTKVANSMGSHKEDMKKHSFSEKDDDENKEIDAQCEVNENSIEISKSSPMQQSPSQIKGCKEEEEEEEFDSKSFYKQMASQIKTSTKAAKDVQSKLRRLRTTELQKSQSTWESNSSGISLTCLQLKMLRFIDAMWDLNGSATLSNVGTSGKTIAVAASLWKHRDDGPQLVFCPPNALIRWRHELRQFSELQVLTLGFSGGAYYRHRNNSYAYEFHPKEVVLCDLSFLETGQKQDPLWKVSWSCVILDARILPLTHAWYLSLDKLLSFRCQTLRRLIIEPSTHQEENIDHIQAIDHYAVKLTFIHGAQRRKRTRFTKYEVFSWAKQECEISNSKEENFIASIMDVFHQAINPFTFHHDDIDQRITPLSSYYKEVYLARNNSKNILRKRKSRDSQNRQNLLHKKWTIRKCNMSDLQSQSYEKCCRSLRGALGISPPTLSDSTYRFVSIANALFSLRQTCLHADLYSVLKTNGLVGDAKIQEFLNKCKTYSAQPDIAIAQGIASGSAKFCELLKILTKDGGVECEMDIEDGEVVWKKRPIVNISQSLNESAFISKNVVNVNTKSNNGLKGGNVIGDNGVKTTLSSPSRVTRKSPRLQQELSPKPDLPNTKKILILASLPEVQVLLCMFLNSCGIPHELFADQKVPRKSDQETQSSHMNVSTCVSNWTESQRSLIRFSNTQSNPSYSSTRSNNILVLSPHAATQHQGGLRISYADLIVDVDSDWSGRCVDLINSIVMACTVRREDNEVKCVRLLSANTCEEHFLSKDLLCEDESDDESSLLIETDNYGYITSAFDEETHQPKLYLGKNIIHHRGKLLKDILGITDLPVDYTTGRDLVFLQRAFSVDTQVEHASSEESANHLWKFYHQDEWDSDEEEVDHENKVAILFGYIFAQVERLKTSLCAVSKIENSKESSAIWNHAMTAEYEGISLFHATSFTNVTNRQDLLTLPARFYCESYGRKYFILCNNNQNGCPQLSQQLDIAESWRKSGLGSSALEQILPLLIYGKADDGDPRNTVATPRKQKKRMLEATSIAKEDISNEATIIEKKKRKKNNNFCDDLSSSSYRGNIYANLFTSCLFSDIITDGNQGMEYVLYTPPTFPGLMSGWKHAKKAVSSSKSLPSRKPMERSRVFKKKKKSSSTNNPFLMSSTTQSMDLDDLTDDFLDSMADASSPFLDFDLSSDMPTLSRNENTAPISLDPTENSTIPSNQAVSTNFEQAAMTPSYQLPSSTLEDTKNTSNIAAMDSLKMGVDDLDMFYGDDHDAHLTPNTNDDFLPHLSDNILDLDFGNTTNSASISIGDSNPNEFDVVDMMGLGGDNLDTLPFMNATATSARLPANQIEDELESVKQINQFTWEDDYGFLGCGLLPLISDSIHVAAVTSYPTARYREGTGDTFYNDLYDWNPQSDCGTTTLDSMVLYVKKSVSGSNGQENKNGSTSVRIKKPKKLHGFVMSDDVYANKTSDQIIIEQKSNKSTSKNASISNCLMRRKIRSLVNISFLSKENGILTSIFQNDTGSSDIHHQQKTVNEMNNLSSTDIVLAPVIQKLSGPDTKTGDKAKVTSSAHRTALRRSLVAPQHVDFGPFSLGYISSSSGFSGIVPPLSQVGIGLPLGVQAPTRESDFMREPWSEEEDVRLKDAAARFCFNWHIVSRSVTDIRRNPGIVLDGVGNQNCAIGHSSTQEVWRCARQCRERWQAFAKAQPSLAKDVRKSERLLREMASIPPSKVPQSLGNFFSNFAAPNITESSSLIGDSTIPSPSMLLSPAFYKRDTSALNGESSSPMFNITQQVGEYGYLKGRLPALQESSSKADYRSNQPMPGSQQAIAQPHLSHVQIAQSPMMISHRNSSSQQQQQAEVWPLQLLDYFEKQRMRSQGTAQSTSSSRIQSNSTPISVQSSSKSSVSVATSNPPQHQHQQQQSKSSSQQQQRSHQVHSQVPHQVATHQQAASHQQRRQQVQQINNAVHQGGKNITQVAQVMNKDRIRIETARPSPLTTAPAAGITINATNTVNVNLQQQPYTVVTNPSYQQQQQPQQIHNPNVVSTTKKETNNS